MVRVWLRPALVALRRQAAVNAQSSALKGASQQASSAQQLLAVRAFSSKKDKREKKKLSEKFVDLEDELTEIPPDVQYMSKETRDENWGNELDPEFIKALQGGDLLLEEDDSESDSDEETTEDEIAQLERMLADSDSDEEEFLEDGDEELSDAEWAAKYERELASMDTGKRDVEDDRVYAEMPYRDSSLMMATEGDADDSDDDSDDDDDDNYTPDMTNPFLRWDQGMAYSPEMLNWMKPEACKPMVSAGKKPWKYFVRANHPDVVELAMDTDLLRLFIAATGRIRPRRFTGLTAKQQRQVARAIKISRQMALLPYLSRYPDPSPAQWAAMEDEEIEDSLAAMEDEDEDDDDDDDDDDEFEGMDDE